MEEENLLVLNTTSLKTVQYVGGYRLGEPLGLTINLQYKPNFIHRFFMKKCLGWEWINY